MKLAVHQVAPSLAARYVTMHHYLHRRPPISHAYALTNGSDLVGVCTYGTPASRHLQQSACPTDPSLVIELNRLWVDDAQPRNTESWFVARTLRLLPPLIVVSYADTAAGHVGYIYRALNFHYAGWTDMERKTPRFDYLATSGLHSRDASRSGRTGEIVRRKPKVRYWITTGTRPDRRRLSALCRWPSMSWQETPPPLPQEGAA